MIRDTLQIGDPRLKAANQPVKDIRSDRVHQIVEDLVDTMRRNQLIGMAAPQIGENVRIFVTEPRQTKTRPVDQSDPLRVFINPAITWHSPEQVVIFEGCGSVLEGKLFGPVKRPQLIRIHYTDVEGASHWLKCDGLLARVIQHEYDHLQGVEFTEKITDYKQLMTVDHYIKYVQHLPEQIETTHINIKEES